MRHMRSPLPGCCYVTCRGVACMDCVSRGWRVQQERGGADDTVQFAS